MAQAVSRDRRRFASDPSTGRFLVSLGVGLTAIISVYLLGTLVVLPGLRISRLTVQADFPVERSDLLAMAGLQGDEHFFSLDTETVRRTLENHYLVKQATVEKSFPNQARITLTRRRPLATVISRNEQDGTRVGLVDEEGMLFSLPATASAASQQAGFRIPVLSGILFQDLQRGMRLPEMVLPFLEDLQRLKMQAPQLFDLFSEFEIVPVRGGGFDVLLYLRAYPVPVRIEGSVDTELCTYVVMVLDALRTEGMLGAIEELDFRAGEIVYRRKEVQIVE